MVVSKYIIPAILSGLLMVSNVFGARRIVPRPAYRATLPKTLMERVDRFETGTLGVRFYPSSTPILAQAVGDVIIQALYSTYENFGTEPYDRQTTFDHSVAARGRTGPTYAAGVHIVAAGNQTGDYRFTNNRLATTLSLLGFDFANQEDLTDLVEYNFDVLVDKWRLPEVVIARGYVSNNVLPSGVSYE